MTTMIERMAVKMWLSEARRGLKKIVPNEGAFRLIGEENIEFWRRSARIALEAMEEPTEVMITAMDEHAGTIAPEYAYQAAITAALEEGE